MLHRIVQSVTFFTLLLSLDRRISQDTRTGGCPHCGGSLSQASYRRKAGGAAPMGEGGCREATRYGLWCRSCNRRCLPPSVLFLGRKSYVLPAILLATMMVQGRRTERGVGWLRKHLGVSEKTLLRWVDFFRGEFRLSSMWQARRSHLGAAVSDSDLPGSLLVYFWRKNGRGEAGLRCCLCFLAVGRVEVQGV